MTHTEIHLPKDLFQSHKTINCHKDTFIFYYYLYNIDSDPHFLVIVFVERISVVICDLRLLLPVQVAVTDTSLSVFLSRPNQFLFVLQGYNK